MIERGGDVMSPHHQATLYLLITAGGLLILGPALAAATVRRLEIGALAPWAVCWTLAVITLILAVGSLL